MGLQKIEKSIKYLDLIFMEIKLNLKFISVNKCFSNIMSRFYHKSYYKPVHLLYLYQKTIYKDEKNKTLT